MSVALFRTMGSLLHVAGSGNYSLNVMRMQRGQPCTRSKEQTIVHRKQTNFRAERHGFHKPRNNFEKNPGDVRLRSRSTSSSSVNAIFARPSCDSIWTDEPCHSPAP